MFRRVDCRHQPGHRAEPGARPGRQPARGQAARRVRDDRGRRAVPARHGDRSTRRTPPRAGRWPPPAPATCSPTPSCTPTRSAATSRASRTGSARRSRRCTGRWPRSWAPGPAPFPVDAMVGPAGRGRGGGARAAAVRAGHRGAVPQADRRAGDGPARARRPAPRSGAAHPGRLAADRLRGRARAAAGRAPPARLAAARRRRHAALASSTRPTSCWSDQDDDEHLAARAREWVDRNRPRSATGTPHAAGADPREQGALLARTSWTRRSTRPHTRPGTGPDGCASRCGPSPGSSADYPEDPMIGHAPLPPRPPTSAP